MEHNWTVGEQAGQMMMVGFDGKELTRETEQLIRECAIGGVILFGRNYDNPEQLHGLISDLQALAASTGSGQPLFVSVDQEGGRVARLKVPFTEYPPLCCLGEAKSEELAYRFGRALALELAEVGINMDHAPVLDVHTNPKNPVIGDRAFSHDPEWTARLGKVFIQAFRDAGLVPVGKHFPGHGDTLLDSHLDLPYVERSAVQLEAVELVPFRQTIASGLPAIMTAHVMYPAWDDQRPATFSPAILRGILREQLGFEGIIISDDLEMKAVEKHFTFDAFPRLGLEAGVDVFLICHEASKVRALHEGLTRLAEADSLQANRMDSSVQRILKLKRSLHPTPEKSPDTQRWQSEHAALAEEMQSYLPTENTT